MNESVTIAPIFQITKVRERMRSEIHRDYPQKIESGSGTTKSEETQDKTHESSYICQQKRIEVLYDFHHHGLSYKDLASTLNVSYNSVRYILNTE